MEEFFIDSFFKSDYAEVMNENLEQIADELHLTGAKKTKFVREAKALRVNLKLRQKQKKEREAKCTHSK